MKFSQGLAMAAVVGVLVLLATGGFGDFSVPGTDEEAAPDINPELLGKDATVDTIAQDDANTSTPDVSANVDLYHVSDGEEDHINSDTTNSDGSRKSISGMQVGENFAVYYGVEDSNYYATRDPNTGEATIDKETVRSEGGVHGILASGDTTVKIYDSDDSDVTGSSVTVGSGETYNFEKVRARAGAEDVSWNVEYIYVNDTELSGVDEWRLDGAEEIDVPEKLASDYSHAFALNTAGDLTAGEDPTLGAHEKIEPGQLSLDMESGQDPSGDVDICVDDAATYKDTDDTVHQGAENEDDNDVGLAAQCSTVTIN